MRTRYNKRRFRTAIMIILILFCMSIGYSYLLTTLNIEGTSNIKANTWDVHWENVSVKSGSVTGDQVPIDAYVMSDTTQVEYSVILKNPGDYYEFTVDAKNSGSLDAMVSITDTKFYESNGVTQINLPNYLEYEFLYSNGVRIEPNQLLAANSSRTIKVKIKFKDNLEESELPTTDKTIVIRHSITYVQADENAIEVPNTRFEQDSWDEIDYNLSNTYGNYEYYNVGDTKDVDMGSFGTHTLRIANKSNPVECNGADFSKTACGFVLEFTDVIVYHRMNATNTNVGGWPATEMRTYINSDIFDSLPSDLQNIISNTKVISGHGSNDSNNFTSTDKMYLFSSKEIWGKEGNQNVITKDSAEVETRQLDYYKAQNVTTNSYAGAIKQYNGTDSFWWLRSAYSDTNNLFFRVRSNGYWSNDSANLSTGVSPAFRISIVSNH